MLKRTSSKKIDEAVAKSVNFEVTVADLAKRSERRAWWVAGSSLVMSLILAGGYFYMLPLKEKVPYMVMADAYTGTATVARLTDDFTNRQISTSEAINCQGGAPGGIDIRTMLAIGADGGKKLNAVAIDPLGDCRLGPNAIIGTMINIMIGVISDCASRALLTAEPTATKSAPYMKIATTANRTTHMSSRGSMYLAKLKRCAAHIAPAK